MWNTILKFLPSVGLWIIGGGLQVSGVEIPWLGFTLIGLGFICLTIPGFHYWKVLKGKSIKNFNVKTEISMEKVSKRKHLPDTLIAMHRRLIELQKKKASSINVQAKQLENILPTLADRLGTVNLKDWPKFKRSIKSRIRRVIPRRPKKIWRKPFDIIKWREKVHIVAINEAVKMRDELFNSKEWTFKDGLKISEWLDGYDLGVKKLRDNDKQWNALFMSLNPYFDDKVLRQLIDKNINFSYMYNNISLIIHYSEKWKNNEFSLMLHEALVGSPISPEKAELALGEIQGDITKRFEEIEKPKLFEIICRTKLIGLPINRLENGTFQASKAGVSGPPVTIKHLGDLTTVNRVAMSPMIIFTRADKKYWESSKSIEVLPQNEQLVINPTRGLTWNTQNPKVWELVGLPLTMAKWELLVLPIILIRVTDGNDVGIRFEKGEICELVIQFSIRTDKGNPTLPEQRITLRRSDIKDSPFYKVLDNK